ncbi:PQQ-binding-like beta-propeller repeat protein [Dyadobacter sp. LHD-138]|uniref:outer membrane protein assembly factor BamB family protein n=1 Tax=Dyadobacter sp. LHD-138 TaxID=3071413 RepID=UPI0027DF87C0|nr:PQQ-binding-like beta-propeller repeat protein [Dyadobacter sp. LHD-138]MDQ6480537.1 PQQ-binding-like beta-propeller repeat protein [Dyadobacter sp. LHD-138]
MMRLTDNKIYIGGTKFSYILDAETGRKIQSYPIGELVNPIDGTFYAMNNEKILAVDSKSGSVKWELQKTNPGAYTYPVVANGSCFFGTSGGKLFAYDAETGKKKWERQFGEYNQGGFHQLATENGMLFASYMNGKMLAIDQSTGNTQWESQMYNPDDISPWNFEVKGNFIYAWAINKVVALDKQTGLKKWEKTMNSLFTRKPRVFDDTQLDL